LSQLAYNPSAVPGAGRNLVQTQAAQDALLTVNGRPYASASNTVTGAVTGITLSASEAGAAQVSISRDADSALKSAQAFTSAYNQLRDQISLVQSDSVSRQIAGNIGAAAGNATVNTAQGNLSLPQLGISQASDGKLTLDAGKFRAAFSANPEGAANLLATAAKRVESAADSAINGPLRSATQAIQTATGNGDNPYVVPAAAQTPQQLILGSLPTLLPYSPTTRNLYGLSQYLSISGL
jgi:flagellar hook-associated protein 2